MDSKVEFNNTYSRRADEGLQLPKGPNQSTYSLSGVSIMTNTILAYVANNESHHNVKSITQMY